jgi:hypothetical protein
MGDGNGSSSSSSSSSEEQKYSHDELLANSRLLTGHSRRVLAGALATVDQKKLTTRQAKGKVDTFLKRDAAPADTVVQPDDVGGDEE